MHLMSDSMTGEFTYDSIVLLFAMVLYCRTYVSQMLSCLSSINTEEECLFCDLQQLLHFFSYLADTECIGRITIEAVEQSTAIHRNDIAIFKDDIVRWDPMDDNIIDRGTNAGGKRPSIRIRETLECWDGSVVTYELVRNLIQLEGRYTRLDMFCQLAKRTTNKLVSLAHQL